MGEGGICEIKRERIIDDAGEPGRSHGPAFGPAGLVEPSMDDLELAPKPLRWHRDPHPYWKLPLGLALRQIEARVTLALRSWFVRVLK
jgi:hypothetical protein